ncbi:cytochrome c [Nitrogeniibacter mangrovi]|uniref:Cytochrome c n=1 Tax=Nitrogeniibacter mangrovi TaxID=2016596 RepID=A0A6C1BC99_9RHOO|nr:cytochrome c [Nitrogeniibacter mangrovi]
MQAQDAPYYAACAREGLDASQCAGRLIWFKATAGNDRFNTYVFQQRMGVLIDWFRVLRSDQRDDRFRAWGVINDPGCCTPGDPNCPAKSLDETYGFDWCPGDAELLKYVGKPGYRDPACDFKDAALKAGDPHGPEDQRQSACDLAFGTSAGALGFRKFPNPRFDRDQWIALNGRAGSWAGYAKPIPAAGGSGEPAKSRLMDGSVEPPFLIGTACGSCHIAFDPLNPPKDPAHPAWENIKGLQGNQYSRISEIMVSGMATNTLEWQMFAHARPGTTDTSAIPNDQVNNPGTINALINIPQRPVFAGEQVLRWHKTRACEGQPEAVCWCEPGREGKCWEKSLQTETVHHILKGGEDSIGALGAIQRVYFNIGSCSEACWMNHLSDLRQLDPQQRGFGQTPFDIGQCRRDCPNFRAIEDRLDNVLDFFMSAEARATDLREAREHELRKISPTAEYSDQDLIADLNAEFGDGAVARGEQIFKQTCARCHSSSPEAAAGNFDAIDFHKTDPKSGLRADWMGNDQATLVSEVGTFRCRALHSNHMSGHIWAQFGSETLRARPPDPNVKEPSDGGRGYYRNISLLNLWAHAPFMHNNAIGPELCGQPANKANAFYAMRPRYVDARDLSLLPPEKQPACWAYDPSVTGRYDLFKASVDALLHPDQRMPKVTLLNEDVTLRIGPRLWDGTDKEKLLGFSLTIPATIDGRGVNAGTLGNFQHKAFVVDLVQAKFKPAEVEKRLVAQWGEQEGKRILADLKGITEEVTRQPNGLIEALKKRPYLVKKIYSSCFAEVENAGHRFGEDLSEADKKALTAFLATL